MLSWLTPPVPQQPVLRYEDLAADPVAAVGWVVAIVAPHLAPRSDAVIPSLDELRRTDNRFFRRGHTGTHRD